MTVLAKCHLMMGHWIDAMKAAEIVLAKEKRNVGALLVKAEALYNTCFFEHALVLFHRGKVQAPPGSQEFEDFRLGIQKCHKTIGTVFLLLLCALQIPASKMTWSIQILYQRITKIDGC